MTQSETYEIELDGKVYPLRLRQFAQSRSITVSADIVKNEVKLNMPRRGSKRQALRFAESKALWLAARFAEALPAIILKHGAEIAIAGHSHKIMWSKEHGRTPTCTDGVLQVGGPQELVGTRLIRWMKAEARKAYEADLEFYCARAGVNLPSLSVGDARRRWGSCSGRRAIRLSWRLYMAPVNVRRSVVAHEVAHLVHMNHSAVFYGLLDEIFEGDRKQADRWLKQHGSALHLVGAEPA